MSHMILIIGDLDLDLHGQIGLQTSKVLVSTVKNLTVSNFTFRLELFIKHLNVIEGFEN